MELTKEDLLRKLRYQSCYRGCKESDYVLEKFVNKHLVQLTDDELLIYEKFLAEEDVHIMDWVMDKSPCPHEYAFVLDKIKEVIG